MRPCTTAAKNPYAKLLKRRRELSQPERLTRPASHNDTRQTLLDLLAPRRNVLLRADVVAFQLSVQRCAADSEHLAGHNLIAIHLFENALDGGALDCLEIAGGAGTVGRCGIDIYGGVREHTWREVGHVDNLAIAECCSTLDAVLEF